MRGVDSADQFHTDPDERLRGRGGRSCSTPALSSTDARPRSPKGTRDRALDAPGGAELAYLLDRRSERKGFATEAVRRIVSMCFEELQLHKVFLRTIVGNERSATVARRCGFVLEGTSRGEFLAAGHLRVDVHYFDLLATDHRSR